MAAELKYPIGVQTFEEIIRHGFIYVDKTARIHQLVNSGKYIFISRPRRFGKSLLLSTVEALFSGERELFRGLDIYSTDWQWARYPVFHLDLNVANYDNEEALISRLTNTLSDWESEYGIQPMHLPSEQRFENIIKTAYEQTGRQVVILIDEYDKPLVRTLGNRELQDGYRNQLQAFYGVLKSLDRYIRFALLTGVTRFSKVNVFSGLNNLRDISLEEQFNDLCGITDREIDRCLERPVAEYARAQRLTVEEARRELRFNYDGYHFGIDCERVYNPFSLLNALQSRKKGAYLAETGTPTFLVDMLRREHFPLQDQEDVMRSEQSLRSSDSFRTDIVPMLYQTGYLTIKGYDRSTDEYILGLPNEEVRKSFLEFIIPSFYTT